MPSSHQQAPRFGSPAHLRLLQEGRRRLTKIPSERSVRDYLETEIRLTEEQLGLRPRQGDLFGVGYDMHHLKLQLTYDDLVNLAATLDRGVRTEQAPEGFSGASEALRAYASEVGIGWVPAAPEQLSLMAFIAKAATSDQRRRTSTR